MNPYNNLEQEKTRIEKKRQFLIDEKRCLCEHDGLNPMIEIKGNIPQAIYTII